MSDIQNGNNVLRQLLLLASSEALIGEWRLIARSVMLPSHLSVSVKTRCNTIVHVPFSIIDPIVNQHTWFVGCLAEEEKARGASEAACINAVAIGGSVQRSVLSVSPPRAEPLLLHWDVLAIDEHSICTGNVWSAGG